MSFEIYKKDLKATAVIAVPVIIGQLGQMMMGVVDSVMVGKIGAAPLAASSIANGLFIMLLVIGIGIAAALSPLVSIRVGAGKPDECGVVLRQGLLVNVIAAFILMLVNNITAEGIRYMDQPPEVAAQAIIYMKTLGWSMIPVMIFLTYKQFIEGLSIMRPAMVITLLANLINVFVNWLLIFGNFGFPAMGLEGAGWATFSTRIVMAIALLLYIYTSAKFKPFDVLLHYRRIDWPMIREIIRVGVPGGFQFFFEVGAFGGSALIIGWLGTAPLAAHQIALNLASITYMFAIGYASAAAIRVGQAFGAKDIPGMRRAGLSSFVLGAATSIVFAVSLIILRFALPELYIDDAKVQGIATSLIIIAAIFQLSDGAQAVGIGALRGLTDVKVPTIITFIAYWVVGIPGGYLLSIVFGFGVQGVWYGFVLALTVSAVLLGWRFREKTRHLLD